MFQPGYHDKACLAVIYIRTCGMDVKDIAMTVNHKMPFYAFDLLESVDSFDGIRQPAAPACTVYMAHRRHFVPTAAFTGVSEKERVYPFENSGRMPVPPFIIHGLPVWVTSRKQPPLAATAKQVEYGLHDSERVMLSPAPYQTGELFRQYGSDFPCHHRNADERIIIFLYQTAR